MSIASFTACSSQEHDAIKARVEYFEAETTGHEKWLGLLTGQCRICSSTLALQLCKLCGEACPTTDALPWGPPADETVAHFKCAAEVLVSGKRVGRFVILAGKTTAREFDTVALSARGGTR